VTIWARAIVSGVFLGCVMSLSASVRAEAVPVFGATRAGWFPALLNEMRTAGFAPDVDDNSAGGPCALRVQAGPARIEVLIRADASGWKIDETVSLGRADEERRRAIVRAVEILRVRCTPLAAEPSPPPIADTTNPVPLEALALAPPPLPARTPTTGTAATGTATPDTAITGIAGSLPRGPSTGSHAAISAVPPVPSAPVAVTEAGTRVPGLGESLGSAAVSDARKVAPLTQKAASSTAAADAQLAAVVRVVPPVAPVPPFARERRFSVGVAGGVVAASGGVGVPLAGGIAFRYTGAQISVWTRAELALTEEMVGGDEGSATIRPASLSVGAAWLPWSFRGVSPLLGAEAAGFLVRARGVAQPGFRGQTVSVPGASVGPMAGVRWLLGDRVSALVQARAGVMVWEPSIAFSERTVAAWKGALFAMTGELAWRF
jgi:hypothetical protein